MLRGPAALLRSKNCFCSGLIRLSTWLKTVAESDSSRAYIGWRCCFWWAVVSARRRLCLIEKLADNGWPCRGIARRSDSFTLRNWDWQVGQPAKVVAPDLLCRDWYFRLRSQHLAGMKDSKIIVAIKQRRRSANLPGLLIYGFGR